MLGVMLRAEGELPDARFPETNTSPTCCTGSSPSGMLALPHWENVTITGCAQRIR
jgi:hypothetical protein